MAGDEPGKFVDHLILAKILRIKQIHLPIRPNHCQQGLMLIFYDILLCGFGLILIEEEVSYA